MIGALAWLEIEITPVPGKFDAGYSRQERLNKRG